MSFRYFHTSRQCRFALATRALENGFSVSYYNVDEWMHQLKQDGAVHPMQLKHRKYMASNLLVLDEFGYQSMSREEANLFFRVVSYRSQKGSTIITTNKGIGSWPGVLAGDEVLAGAILDRLLHSATVHLKTNAPSVNDGPPER